MAERQRKSKKPSATKAESLLEASTFFVDRCLGRTVGLALRQAGLKVEFHSDHFEDDSPDEVWISEVGRQGWIVLTKDKAIQRRDVELQAVVDAKVRMFIGCQESNVRKMASALQKNRAWVGHYLPEKR